MWRIYLSLLFSVAVVPAFAQFERTRVNFVCPCALISKDGEAAEISFGLVNNTEEIVRDLHVTLGIVGDMTTESDESVQHVALVNTIATGEDLEPEAHIDTRTYEIDLGELPEGWYYFELLLHESERFDGSGSLDSVWFQGEHETPVQSLSLTEANYLVDSDEDGVGDINETLEGTDLNDAESVPPIPVIDVLVLHEAHSFERYNVSVETFIGHVLTATNDMYERSNSPIHLRAVGVLDANDLPEIEGGNPLDRAGFEPLLEEYQADVVVVFRAHAGGICGYAVTIGGKGDKGFLHPNERFAYTEVFLDPTICGIAVTAHELGHLMGLGHSFEQLSTGAYVWSRGHAVHGEFGTIMTYARSFFSAIVADVFSNPRQDCHGVPCGVVHTEPNAAGSADSVLSVNVLKYQFARTSEPDSEFDFDGDGVGAVDDAFPIDASETSDTDGDRFGDNRDAFPYDPLEWADTDGDGIGDNSDPDIDDDGIFNLTDPNPFDAALTEVRLIGITSDEEGDEFGYSAVQVNDLGGDGIRDLAVSAPGADGEDANAVGKTYVLSVAKLVERPSSESATPGTKTLLDVLSEPDSWVLHGQTLTGRFGHQLELLDHGDSGSELVILAQDAVYVLELDAETLSSLDGEDGTEDQRLYIEHCDTVQGCLKVQIGDGLEVTDVASIGDLDGDGESDLGVVAYATNRRFETLVYLLPRTSISSVAVDALSIGSVFKDDTSVFRLATSGINGLGDLEYLGGTNEDASNDLAFGVVGNDEPGRVFILRGSQLQSLNKHDEDGDRQIDIDSLVSSSGTLRVTDAEDTNFGIGIDPITDIEGDSRNDLVVWGSRFRTFAFTSSGLTLHDQNDLEADGSVELTGNFRTVQGTWHLNFLSLGTPATGSKVLPALGADSVDLLVTPRTRAMFIAELGDLDYLDDPTGQDLNGYVSLPLRIRYPGIYELRVPVGPRGDAALAGVTTVGDLDNDQKHEIAFSVFSENDEGTFSTMYVVYSGELDALDQSDGDTDHIVMLHNSLGDIDEDGIPNLHDDDDDGDGMRDLIDAYPHLKDYRYDADRDGFANAIDAFPLDETEHSDLDFDGIGDREDEDIDGDGILNDEDMYPADTDNDGLPNEDDLDDDNDSVVDLEDAFPLDPLETVDSDGDGVGDNRDVFAMDPNEWLDTDADGVGNNADTDDDGDGYLDEEDAFPLNANEWVDSDGDGYGDNSDAFPLDPYEWADEDGDGYGDNYGSESIASYRLLSEWYALDASTIDFAGANPYSLGDVDRDGIDDLEISNALRHIPGHPTIILSGAELQTLDGMDGVPDHTIDLSLIHQAPSSFRFINLDLGDFAIPYSAATIGDFNGDGESDIVLFDPLTEGASGSFWIIHGDDWSDLDGVDGRMDGQIEFSACDERDWCTRVQSSSRRQGFGINGRFIQDLEGNDEATLMVGTLGSRVRSSDETGVGSAYVLPNQSIAAAEDASTDDLLFVDSIVEFEGAWTFYSERNPDSDTDDESAVGIVSVGRIQDLNRDGIDELLVNNLNSSYIYLLASSDLPLMDSADSAIDRKIDLKHSYPQANSFRIEGYDLDIFNALSTTNYAIQSGNTTSYFLPLLKTSFPQQMYLVDMRQLENHDRAEGLRNGIISTFRTGEYNTWTFPEVDEMKVCQRDNEHGRVQGVATVFSSIEGSASAHGPQVFLFDVRDLNALDRLDDLADGSIDLSTLIDQKATNSWVISFGDLAEHTYNLEFECAGDFDGDDQQDIAVSLHERDGSNVRAQVILISYRNLIRLDELDGDQNGRVDVSALWFSD